MLVPAGRRTVGRSAIGRFNMTDASVGGVASYFSSAANVGPTVSATWFAFCAFLFCRPFTAGANLGWLFGRALAGGAAGGWYLTGDATNIFWRFPGPTVNGTQYAWQPTDIGRVMFCAAQIVGGNVLSYLNGTLLGSVPVVPQAPDATTVSFIGSNGVATAAGTGAAVIWGGVMNGYDSTGFVSPIFGNGTTGLLAQLGEDLQQGRNPTWPRAAVANSDYLWRAQDAVAGSGTTATWVDQYSAISLGRTGAPQVYGTPVRY